LDMGNAKSNNNSSGLPTTLVLVETLSNGVMLYDVPEKVSGKQKEKKS